ncbi:hypothetical protein [Jiangella alba]|uniref:Immunity protein 50 n=1 Tax=Jiangella alba TaxID=561176 RepID=A0A1H5PMI9_9ACTN|nr:hypothetical protein [Jiangella alba]SEF14331.1 hypothetical protein SAMN04488561_4609 [Jiangella alba]
MTPHSYAAFPSLHDVYLEDSWVLGVFPAEHEVTFRIEAVLTAAHPHYQPPKPGEQYCYALADLQIRSTAPIDHQLSGARPAVDRSGTSDLGNIDTFRPTGPSTWELRGDWGAVTVQHPHVDLALRGTTP